MVTFPVVFIVIAFRPGVVSLIEASMPIAVITTGRVMVTGP
jgi:hypothetical protein